jgi:hypothetical protein
MRDAKLRQICIPATATFLLAPQSQGGLIGFWNFDETSGTTAHDTSGSGINGTLSSTGAAFDPGAGLGGGAVSVSSGGYVNMGNHYAFSGAQSFFDAGFKRSSPISQIRQRMPAAPSASEGAPALRRCERMWATDGVKECGPQMNTDEHR